jgi:dolichol-phosphate mannosyltransferase
LAGIAWEIIVVDDSSPDGTAELAKQMARSDPRVRCLRRVRRYGLAGACIDCLLASSANYVAVMDADLQHDEGVLPALLAVVKRGDADIAIASRYVGTGSTGTGFSEGRAFASRAANRVARLALTSKTS